MSPRIENVSDVAEWQLCSGCGVCAYMDPGAIEMVDDLHYGRRPQPKGALSSAVGLDACPGIRLERRTDQYPKGTVEDLENDWGPVLTVWEGYAKDDVVRRGSSSGGAATALGLYGLERGGMYGVLHTVADTDDPIRNTTQLSRDRDHLLGGMGSRYSPASPCEGLQLIEDSPAPCMFIGKPCDVAAASAAGNLIPALDKQLGMKVSIFCAGTPSTHGTKELLKTMGITESSDLGSFTYRGKGWPGDAEAREVGSPTKIKERMSYAQSWGILQRYRQWRCYVCVDHTGEFSDISVGDPWYRTIEEGEAGRSLIVARSERGRKFVQAASDAGFLSVREVSPSRLPDSQPGLAKTQAAIWGRLAACRSMGLPVPSHVGFPLFRNWLLRLTIKQQAQSILGTLKRVIVKRLYRRVGRPGERAPSTEGPIE